MGVRSAVACVLLLVAAGCAHCPPPPPPVVEYQPVEVVVPVQVPCRVMLVDHPQEALPAVEPGDVPGVLQALLEDLRAWRRAFFAQRAAAEACAGE